MQVSHYVEELQRQLINAAAAGGDETAAVERLVVALEAAGRLTILDALSEAVGEITGQLTPGSVDLRLRGREVEFAVSRPPVASTDEQPTWRQPPAAVEDDEDGSASRTTVRLPDALKARAAQAAAADGVSLNTWLVRTVAAAVEPSRPAARESHGSSYSGWLRG